MPHGLFDGGHPGLRISSRHVPGPKLLEVSESGGAALTSPCAAWVPQQVQVVTNQPAHPLGHPRRHELGPLFFVGPVEAPSHVVEQSRGEQLRVDGGPPSVVEGLQGVAQSISLGVPDRVLWHAVEGREEVDESGPKVPFAVDQGAPRGGQR